MDKMRLYASERDGLQLLSVAYEILTQEMGVLAPRAMLVPGAKRDMAMIASKIRILLEGFYRTVPEDQLKTLRRNLQMLSYTIGVRSPGAQKETGKEYGLWLPLEALHAIMLGLNDHCMLCDLDKAQRRACPLRKALDIIPNDSADRLDGDCQYYAFRWI